jgi:hypothetical protein
MTIKADLDIDPVPGRFYTSTLAVANSTLAITAGVMYAIPYRVSKTATYVVLGVEITTNTAGNFRFGIYNDSGGVPGSLKLDAGIVAMGGALGFKSAVINQILAPGWYWLAFISDATPTVRAITAASALQWTGFTTGLDVTTKPGFTVAQAYGALPDPFTAGGVLAAINPPRTMIGT